MKLDKKAFANTSGIFMGIVYVFCSIAIALFPGLSLTIAQSWVHGIDFGVIWTAAPRGNFFLGLITAVGLTWVAGWVFAECYNYFLGKK